MTDTTITYLATRPSVYRRTSDWIGRTQAEMSDHVHADGDALATVLGWSTAAGTGALGFGDRTYHDPRWTARRRTMVRRRQRRPAVRRPLAELAVPGGRVRISEHLR
jgi:hypothetical protein